MNKLVNSTFLLTCGLFLAFEQSIHAYYQSMVISPNVSSSQTTSSHPASSRESEVKKGGSHKTFNDHNSNDEEESNEDMPAWMLESSKAAQDYLADLDNGRYDQTWKISDQLFQHTITQNEWTHALNSNRKILGRVKSRALKLQEPKWNPKGLPMGPYMVIEYETNFENAPQAKELLTLRRGTDGKWRILTYQVN